MSCPQAPDVNFHVIKVNSYLYDNKQEKLITSGSCGLVIIRVDTTKYLYSPEALSTKRGSEALP